MATFTLADQAKCVDREIRQRQRVYPHLVANGRMTEDAMRREIACMRAVLATLRGLDGTKPLNYAQEVSGWHAPPDLFADERSRRWNDRT